MSKSSQLCSHGRLTTAYCQACAEAKFPETEKPAVENSQKNEQVLESRLEAMEIRLPDTDDLEKQLRRCIRAFETIERVSKDMQDELRRLGPK